MTDDFPQGLRALVDDGLLIFSRCAVTATFSSHTCAPPSAAAAVVKVSHNLSLDFSTVVISLSGFVF